MVCKLLHQASPLSSTNQFCISFHCRLFKWMLVLNSFHEAFLMCLHGSELCFGGKESPGYPSFLHSELDVGGIYIIFKRRGGEGILEELHRIVEGIHRKLGSIGLSLTHISFWIGLCMKVEFHPMVGKVYFQVSRKYHYLGVYLRITARPAPASCLQLGCSTIPLQWQSVPAANTAHSCNLGCRLTCRVTAAARVSTIVITCRLQQQPGACTSPLAS